MRNVLPFCLGPFIYNPFGGYLSFFDKLAHKMFLTTLETTTHVYVQVWGPKETCHDTLEPIRAGGRGPRGPGGPRRSAGRTKFLQKIKMLQNIFQKNFLKSTVTQCLHTENKVIPHFTIFGRFFLLTRRWAGNTLSTKHTTLIN